MRSDVSAGTSGLALAKRLRDSRLPPPDDRRAIRERAGATLREMAEAMNVTATMVLRWERGEHGMRRAHAIAYRKLLDALREAS